MVKSKAFIISVDYDEDMNGNFDIDKVVIENALAFYFEDLPEGMIKKIEVDELGFMDLDIEPLDIENI